MGKFIEYSDGTAVFEGYLSYDNSTNRKRPCLLLAHAWDGPNDYFNQQAREWAQKGYCALAIDVYGKGVRGKIDGDNSALMNPLLEDRRLLRQRLLAAFQFAKTLPFIIPDQMAIMGYCFGGLCALDLARAAPNGLTAAISVHAPLSAPQIGDQDPITASILILHGWEDPIAPPQDVVTIASELTKAKADWQLMAFGHAQHAFTFVGADIPQLGIKYDEKAHRRSQLAISNFLKEKFGKAFPDGSGMTIG